MVNSCTPLRMLGEAESRLPTVVMCFECRRKQDRRRWLRFPSMWGFQCRMSSWTLIGKLPLLWTLVTIAALCFEAEAAPEALHRRAGDASILPINVLRESEELPDQEKLLREDMNAVMEFLQQYQQQQQGGEDEQIGPENGPGPAQDNYPPVQLPPAIQARLLRLQDGLNKDDSKRGSYMTMCHFKICNMGRKRNLRYPWLHR